MANPKLVNLKFKVCSLCFKATKGNCKYNKIKQTSCMYVCPVGKHRCTQRQPANMKINSHKREEGRRGAREFIIHANISASLRSQSQNEKMILINAKLSEFQ